MLSGLTGRGLECKSVSLCWKLAPRANVKQRWFSDSVLSGCQSCRRIVNTAAVVYLLWLRVKI